MRSTIIYIHIHNRCVSLLYRDGPPQSPQKQDQFARRRNNQGRRKQTIRLSGSRPCPHHARVPERTGAERVQSAGDSLSTSRVRARAVARRRARTPRAAAVGLPLQLATNGLRAVSPVQLEAFRLEPLRSDHRLERPVLPQLLVLLVGQPARHLHASRTVAWVWRAVPCTANARRHAVCSRVLLAGGARGAWMADQSGTPSLIARNFCS